MRVFTSECTRGRLSLGAISLFRAVFLTAFCLLFATATAMAQSAGTGTITGRVQNATNGTYLNNARVILEGTDRTVFTNEYGEYVLSDVPAGEAKIRAFYTGFEPKVTSVTVAAGQTVTQDVKFGAATDGDTVMLDAFTVKAGRETNIAQIATNEQRFSPNIKTVIETNAFGDIAEGNAGEFLKYLPGVTVDYVAADVRTVNVRGFGAAFTSTYIDGFRMASAASGSSIRAFEFEQVSINNAARVEVIKAPTPDFPADALGGAVNLISKNAFEREGSAFNYRAYLNANSEDTIPWKKTSGPKNKDSYKVLPGFDFDYTIPVSKSLGFVVTGLSSNQFNEQHRSQGQWNSAQGVGATQGTATPASPYLQQYQLQDGPKNSYRDSLSIKGDWKIAPGQSLWAMYQVNYYESFFGNRNLTWDVGTAGAPLPPATATALSYGPDFTSGATGRASLRHGTSFRDKYGVANAGATKYHFRNRDWDIDAGVGLSTSRSWYRDTGNGHFQEVRTTLQNLSRITYAGIQEPRPATLTSLAADGTPIDQYNLSNYRINTVRSTPLDAKDKFSTLHLNVKRNLEFLPFNASLKFGGETRKQDRDIRRTDKSWTFVGADGVANTADDNAGPWLDTNYGAYPYWGFQQVTWPDPYKLWDAFKSNPSWFLQTPAQLLAAERFRIQNSQKLQETVNSAYVMGEAHFLNNRLGVIAGVRFEQTKDKGTGVYSPTNGASLGDIQANWKERGLNVSQNYDGYYPSAHFTYNITENLLFRLSYARSLGRPDFSQILPLVRVNNAETEFDDGLGTLPARTIRYNNTGLRPYQANNYDTSLEYYFRNGGVVSIGAFYKTIKDFFGIYSSVATAEDLAGFGLPADYLGYNLTTTINTTGSAKIQGGEFNFKQPLTMIPGWGKYFMVVFNATKLNLSGPNTADFSGFIEKAANAGITFDKKPFVFRVNVNYRGRQMNSIQSGAPYGTAPVGGLFKEYYAPRYNVDVNAEYRYNKHFAVFANVRNLFNQYQQLERYNSLTPDYAKMYRREKFGAQLTIGVKGTF